jgi:hypothetical protein
MTEAELIEMIRKLKADVKDKSELAADQAAADLRNACSGNPTEKTIRAGARRE